MKLRPYQEELVNQIRTAVAEGHKRILVQLPTGGGKTVIFRHLIGHHCTQGERSLVIAHREELIYQAALHLEQEGLVVGLIKAGEPPSPIASVQVASIQTLARRAAPPATLVVWDEAHHCKSASYVQIMESYPNAIHLGFTATPARLDGQGFEDIFETLVCGPKVMELISQGALVRPRCYLAFTIQANGIKQMGGDYKLNDLERVVRNTTGLTTEVVKSWQQRAYGKRTVVFGVSISHSRALCQGFCSQGIPAVHLDGSTPPLKGSKYSPNLPAERFWC
ncbi:MAG: DEAD/DEAH box helicase family protein [Synechococcaceae cyanobacterium SM2_3_2]|nr:DEAD/DEAH box helicase family protein [Synechococcaceae cyanobacterium SM2_3_2]